MLTYDEVRRGQIGKFEVRGIDDIVRLEKSVKRTEKEGHETC